MVTLRLFMALVGCRPLGRNTEQHDVFFGIGENIKDILPAIYNSWPEAKKKIHLDAWREVTQVDGYAITVVQKNTFNTNIVNDTHLFFINLGGYKSGEFEEFHYKIIIAASDKRLAIQKAKQTAFYQHTGFKKAPSHIDDKYGVDVDDIFEIKDILPTTIKEKYQLILSKASEACEDILHLGYMPVDKL